jgi:hypothetical protein
MREKRMGDIGMLKRGVLVCLLDGKGEVVSCVVWLLSSVDLGD